MGMCGLHNMEGEKKGGKENERIRYLFVLEKTKQKKRKTKDYMRKQHWFIKSFHRGRRICSKEHEVGNIKFLL